MIGILRETAVTNKARFPKREGEFPFRFATNSTLIQHWVNPIDGQHLHFKNEFQNLCVIFFVYVMQGLQKQFIQIWIRFFIIDAFIKQLNNIRSISSRKKVL